MFIIECRLPSFNQKGGHLISVVRSGPRPLNRFVLDQTSRTRAHQFPCEASAEEAISSVSVRPEAEFVILSKQE